MLISFAGSLLQKDDVNFDFSKAKLVEPRLIKKIQQLKQKQKEKTMIIELSQLPQGIQQQILTTQEPLQIVNDGKVIKNFVPTKSYANGDVSFDLDRMKYMMDTEFHPMPKFADDEEFFKWVNA